MYSVRYELNFYIKCRFIVAREGLKGRNLGQRRSSLCWWCVYQLPPTCECVFFDSWGWRFVNVCGVRLHSFRTEMPTPLCSFLDAIAKLRNASISFVVSVCPSVWNNSASTGRNWIKFASWIFFESMQRKIEFLYNLTRITGVEHEGVCTFMILYRWILRTMREVCHAEVVQKVRTYILCSNNVPPPPPPLPKIVPLMR